MCVVVYHDDDDDDDDDDDTFIIHCAIIRSFYFDNHQLEKREKHIKGTQNKIILGRRRTIANDKRSFKQSISTRKKKL